MSKSDLVYLIHILDCIEKIEGAVNLGKEKFESHYFYYDSAIKNLENIGEVVKKLSPEIKNSCSNIRWERLAGLRNILVHDYLGIDLDLVWKNIELHIPELKTCVQELVSKF